MKILAWVGEIVEGVETALSGMALTARFVADNVLDREGGATSLTIDYPTRRKELPDGYRGHLFNDVDRCTVCRMCARACPIDCIGMEGELNENSKFHVSRYDIDLSKCIYCGLCTQACPTGSLSMTKGFEIEPENSVNARGGRYLFRARADQLRERLDTAEVERLNRLTLVPEPDWSDDDRAFMQRIEDREAGTFLFARYGMGFYTPDEKARVDATRAEKKKAREAAQAAQAAAQSDSVPGAPGGNLA